MGRGEFADCRVRVPLVATETQCVIGSGGVAAASHLRRISADRSRDCGGARRIACFAVLVVGICLVSVSGTSLFCGIALRVGRVSVSDHGASHFLFLVMAAMEDCRGIFDKRGNLGAAFDSSSGFLALRKYSLKTQLTARTGLPRTGVSYADPPRADSVAGRR